MPRLMPKSYIPKHGWVEEKMCWLFRALEKDDALSAEKK